MNRTIRAGRDGDDTRIGVRLVVAPFGGTFRPAPVADVTTEGEVISIGGIIGHIDGPDRNEAVVSFCTGFLVRLLVEPGERVHQDQPVAWLHPVDRPATRPIHVA